jgi:hypothetical protein
MTYRLLRLFAPIAAIMCLNVTGSVAQTSVKNYFFGNSLVNHLSDTEETAVPYWMAKFADDAGHSYAADGQWGFLQQFPSQLPPKPNWSFPNVTSAWRRGPAGYGGIGYNTVVINPANFVQYQSPTAQYHSDNPDKLSPVSATLAVFDWVANQGPEPKFYIYEGWSELAQFSPELPPSSQQLADYHAYNIGEYHDWYEAYRDAVQTQRPDMQVELIPVASILATLFTETALTGIPVEDLYSDTAPHGTATLYFLAGAITYAGVFGELPKQPTHFPDSIHRLVAENFDVVLETIAKNMQMSRDTTSAPETKAKVVASGSADTNAFGLTNPSLAMGLNGLADWSTQHPFIDLMKTARPWTGHLKGQWGGMSVQELEDQGYLDPEGWLATMPPEVDGVEAFVLTDQPAGAQSLVGNYRLTFSGEGKFNLSGRSKVYKKSPGEWWFSYTPGDGSVGIAITQTDPKQVGDYLRDFKIVHEDHITLDEAGFAFNPRWLAKIDDLRLVRFMDWMFTNGSEIEGLKDWPRVTDYTYVRRGVPVETMVELANIIGADAWFNMPHKADDTYVRAFATYVHDNLDPDLVAYVEYSNELWNFGFTQAIWAGQMAVKLWGEDAAPDSWIQYAGVRAAEVARIWQDVYGVDADDRLIRVIATHSDWPGLEEGLFHAPLMRAQTPDVPPPVEAFDAYAVTGYFGLELGVEDGPPKVLEWLAESREKAEEDGKKEGLKKVFLNDYIQTHKYDAAVPKAIDFVRNGSLRHYVTEMLPYQSKVAKANDLELIMYEGGTHIVGIAEWSGDEELAEFFKYLNYAPEMSDLYKSLLADWKDGGGTLFNAFVDVAPASQFGSWGTLRHLDDSTDRYDTLMDYNKNQPAWWQTRADGTFLHGGTVLGTDENDDLIGTIKRDNILAGPGDDVLTGLGPADRLHGGAGTDHAILPGGYEDYEYTIDGARLVATSPTSTMTLTEIETFSFADTPDIVFAVESFF